MIVATLTQPTDFESLTAVDTLELEADIAEIRLDAFPDISEAANSVGLGARIPLLFTARHPDEGGQGEANHEERRRALETVAPRAKLIDVELRSLELEAFEGAVAEFQQAGSGVILSHHDFEGTPSERELRVTAVRAEAAGADIVKIATRTDDWNALTRLGSLLADPPVQCRMSVMGMGHLGKASRLLFARMGSALNYGYYRVPNADGQWQAKVFRELLHADREEDGKAGS